MKINKIILFIVFLIALKLILFNNKETVENFTQVTIPEGLYKIKTTYHSGGRQPAGWGLAAWNAHGTRRNGSSSWVAVHSGDYWPMIWNVVKGKKPGTYRFLTTEHTPGKQPAGWGLAAWNAHGAKRNGSSSMVAVHSGDYWPMDWIITKGSKEGTFRIVTTKHDAGKQPAGWGLAAWNAHGTRRNGSSSMVAVHSGDYWPMDWTFERVNLDIPEGLYKIKTTEHKAGKQPAGWGLAAWNAHGTKRNNSSSWVAVHSGDYWPMTWNVVKGKKPGTYRFLTTEHTPGKQPAGWGLAAWNAHGAKRNNSSSMVAVHSGDYWPMDWWIIKGKKKVLLEY